MSVLRYDVSKRWASVVRMARDESGATAIEYGLIVTGISIAILATVFAIGGELNDMFTMINSRMHDRFSTIQ